MTSSATTPLPTPCPGTPYGSRGSWPPASWSVASTRLRSVPATHTGASSRVFFAGAALIAAGLFAFTRTSPWVAVALVFLGAGIAGAIWTLGVPIVAIALVVLFALGARRAGAAKRRARRTPEALSPAGLL